MLPGAHWLGTAALVLLVVGLAIRWTAIIILGLVILIAAVVVGVAGVLGNHGLSHALVHPFAVLGYHVTGSEGRLFFYGIVVGAVGMAANG